MQELRFFPDQMAVQQPSWYQPRLRNKTFTVKGSLGWKESKQIAFSS